MCEGCYIQYGRPRVMNKRVEIAEQLLAVMQCLSMDERATVLALHDGLLD